MKRIPALDGLRTLAIAMVIAYHADKSIFPAGHLGVIVFFVLSGYLITRALTAEADRKGGVDLRFFYLKRGLRLYSALLVVCIALVAAGIDWSRVLPTLGHYANYARIEGFDLGLLTHTWFLSVMAHFYLLWPLVIVAVPARYRVFAIGLLALAALAWRAIAIGVMSPGWVYNSTDTNAAALLAGCYLGVTRPKTWRFAGWSIPLLLALTFLPVFGDQGAAVLWGAFVALALAVMAIQHTLTRPAWLEAPLIVWLGKITYGLYLWHYIFLQIDLPVVVALPLTIATAAASWYLIEKPLRDWASSLKKEDDQEEPVRDDRVSSGAQS